MAARYWVGGTASWDGTAGTKWSTTDGGPGGAAVPTSSDDVYFTAASGAVTVTIATVTANFKTLTCTGFTGTIAGTTGQAAYGDVTLGSGMTWSNSGNLSFQNVTATFTSNGVSFAGSLNVNSGGTVTLGSALTTTAALFVNQGTFTTNNYNVTASQLSSSNTNTRTINLGSSTVTLNGGSTAINAQITTGLTFNAGTSSIVLSGIGSTIAAGNSSGPALTFYNISFTYTSGATTFAFTTSILASPNNPSITVNNLAVSAPASAGVNQVTFAGSCVINGTLSTTGTAGNRRVWFRGNTYGLAQTLTINSAPSLTDADFRDIYVIGTAAPISGTRIGNLRGCSGITFSTPKTVYWNLTGSQLWTATGWATTATGTPSDNNFPLAQDTATFTNAGAASTVTMDTPIPYTGSVDMSGRTNAMTLALNTGQTIYGDWTFGSGVTISNSQTLTFSGRNTQTITSAGKTFSGSITVDSYGGTVQLADALNIGANTLTITNGTFDTKNYNVTANSLASASSNVRSITFGSSTITLSSSSAINFGSAINLTFNAGTSTVVCNASSQSIVATNQTFYNVSFTTTNATTHTINFGGGTFNNITVTAPASSGLTQLVFVGNHTINGTLTIAGASAVRRIFVRSDTLGTTRTLTVNSLSATDCDFRDITIAGTAAGSSPTRAGDCGGNTGITFPAPKTVYWNLAGTNNWSATAWCTGSGGTPDVNNFPLAQDTSVFDNASSITQVTLNPGWNIGTFDASNRTNAMTLSSAGQDSIVYGDWKFGTGVTQQSTGIGLVFSKRGTQTITSNGVTFNNSVTIDCFSGTVQLADALTLASNRTLALISGTFDAVSYNVTVGISSNGFINSRLKMGSGTWTLTGTGTVWDATGLNNTASTFYKGTANIVLTATSTTARTFNGAGLSYNKLTIGGTTGTSTLTITSNNQFTEIASTKTVAHTIALGTTTQTFGKWSVTGTAGNVVTVTGTATITIAGAAVSGVDYLALGTTVLSTTSPGEFFAGANSTGGTNFTLTAAPTPRTLYWVGGTGNWSSTTKWSTSSGGASGAAIPTSLDDVVFDSLSNAVAYTATIDPTQARCKSLTIAGPLVGNVTIAGTGGLACHGSVSLAATGITRTYTGAITLSSSSTGLTFTTNGNTLASAIEVNGVSCGWTLGSALNDGTSTITVTNGSFDTGNYNITAGNTASSSSNQRTMNLGSSTLTLSGGIPISFNTTETARAGLTFTAGTSQINLSNSAPAFDGNNQTFYNVSFTSTTPNTFTVTGANTFNNLSFTGATSQGLRLVAFFANQTINGTLTFSAGTNATMRHFARSDTIGTTRTLTCAAFSGTDVDFRDITIAGAAAPVSGTRLGDCKGNSGITFDAPKTVYWNLTGGGLWTSTAWATTGGGTPAVNNFPLAQDTAVFQSTGLNSGNTVTLNANYNIGTIDMSARTSNTMTLATATTNPTIYGNWINGTGTTISGTTGPITFAGRGSQTITSAGKTFTQGLAIDTLTGSVTLQDAFVSNADFNNALRLISGTFNANGYNVTLSGTGSSAINLSTTSTRTLAVGSGTWTLAGTGSTWNAIISTGLTVTGTGTINLTSASAKTFAGGGLSYSGITLDQGGAGTLTISGNNTFKNITNTYSATGATNITLGTATQTVTQFTATGTSGKVLTIQGTSASSPATLILTSGSVTTPDYLAITGVRAYNLSSTWYAGANSTNNGSLGWIFAAAGGTVYAGTITETATGTDAVSAKGVFGRSISETGTGTDAISAITLIARAIAESASGSDVVSSLVFINRAISESSTATDSASAKAMFKVTTLESASAADAVAARLNLYAALSEAASLQDIVTGSLLISPFINESASISDLLTATALYEALLSEIATSTDVVSAVAAFVSSVSESGTGADALAAKLTARSTISETATAQDSNSSVVLFSCRFVDTATITDTVSLIGTFNAQVSNTATITDRPYGNLNISVQFQDSATLSDAAASSVSWSTVLAETATISDANSAKVTFRSVIAEASTGSDSYNPAGSIYNPFVVAVATGADNYNPAGSVYNVSVIPEAATASDVYDGAFLWNLIDDSQTPNWAGIGTEQSPGWALVQDAQTPGWTNVGTSQSPGWGLVDDSQNPNWQNVDNL